MLSAEEVGQYVEAERLKCREIFNDDPDIDEHDVESCVGDPFAAYIIEDLPVEQLDGWFRVVANRDGTAIEYAHVFSNFFASIPTSPEDRAEAEERAETWFVRWNSVITDTYGPAHSKGQWNLWAGYERSDEANAPCLLWFMDPVAIILCESRPWTPDALEASLAFFRVDRFNPTSNMVRQIKGLGPQSPEESER